MWEYLRRPLNLLGAKGMQEWEGLWFQNGTLDRQASVLNQILYLSRPLVTVS